MSADNVVEPSMVGSVVRAPRSSVRFDARRLPLGIVLGGFAGLVAKELDLLALVSFDGSREALVVFLALAVAGLWALGLRRVVSTVAAGAAALWCLVAFSPLCVALANGLVLRDAPQDTDAVFVSLAALSPGERGRGERWSRLLHGADLVARGKAPLLVVAGADDTSRREAAEMLGRVGLGPDRLLATSGGTSTREEARALAQLGREKKWRLVLVVTSPIHSRRAGAALAKEGVDTIVSPSQETRFDLEELTRAGDRINAFGSVIHERVGLLVYRLRGWV
jgi:uncharacterized SAM-binding protein YcdF (DUF218 family)